MTGRLLHRIAAVMATLSLTVCAGHAQEQPFYFVGDERILLERSTTYRAFKLDSAESEGLRELARSLSNEFDERDPILERYNILLVGGPPESMVAVIAPTVSRDGGDSLFRGCS